jgi:peptide/nickel transport system permease protein
MAIFADFLSPSDPIAKHYAVRYTTGYLHHRRWNGPAAIHLHQKQVLDPATFLPSWQPDLTSPTRSGSLCRAISISCLACFRAGYICSVDTGGTIFLLGSDKVWARHPARISYAHLAIALAGRDSDNHRGGTTGSSGYYGGWVDNDQRLLSSPGFPALPLWMALAASSQTWALIFVAMSVIFALLGWPALARQIRGKVLALRGADFIWRLKRWAHRIGELSFGICSPIVSAILLW